MFLKLHLRQANLSVYNSNNKLEIVDASPLEADRPFSGTRLQ